jgi:tRNA(adenine34) deaminase
MSASRKKHRDSSYSIAAVPRTRDEGENAAIPLRMTAERRMADEDFMGLALAEARAAAEQGEVPVGAVVVLGERVIGSGGNRTITDCDPTAHAEIIALRAAAHAVSNHRILGATLYVTVEPCAMCAGAIIQARIFRVVYGCEDPKGGAVRSCFRIFEHPALNHSVEVTGGLLAEDCAAALQSFFAPRRTS